MGVWDGYRNRMKVRGLTKREAVLNREMRRLDVKSLDSLSYHTVLFFESNESYNISQDVLDSNTNERGITIINSDNLNEKYIISNPGESIEGGGLVYWMDNFWLVTEKDANTTLYTRAKMVQCNYLLKWISGSGDICEQWCVIEDGTKYMSGEHESRGLMVTRGDTRIAMTISRNDLTSKFNRTTRFIIDDIGSSVKIAYYLTKPVKVGGIYNNKGVFRFVLQETNTTDDDDLERNIPDYYKYYPKSYNEGGSNNDSEGILNSDERKVWL